MMNLSTKSLFNIAITNLILGNYKESLITLIQHLETKYTLTDFKLRSEILRGIGSNHFRTYNYKEALKYYYLSESFSIKSHHFENLHSLYQDFGSIV